ncbi:hypothetical protein D3C76_1034750 [compost metagenome]
MASLKCFVKISVEVTLVVPQESHGFAGVFPHAHLRPLRATGADVFRRHLNQVIQLKSHGREIFIRAL